MARFKPRTPPHFLHVDDLPALVLVQVDAGRGGKVLEFLFERQRLSPAASSVCPWIDVDSLTHGETVPRAGLRILDFRFRILD